MSCLSAQHKNTSEQTLKVKSTREVIVLHDYVIRHLETNLYACMV